MAKITKKRKEELLDLIKDAKIEDIKLKNAGFDRFCRMIIYQYYPRCPHCDSVNRGTIAKSRYDKPVWKCRDCGKLTESTYIRIEAPEY